jgi:hypothetical protein
MRESLSGCFGGFGCGLALIGSRDFSFIKDSSPSPHHCKKTDYISGTGKKNTITSY